MDIISLSENVRLEKSEIAALCELYVSGMSITDLSKHFYIRNDQVFRYLSLYYYGVVPKAFQQRITLKSKI